MTYVLFTFDTEDYTSRVGAEAILTAAETLRRHGVQGTFQVVGELAEALIRWGRQDIIEALKHHDIGLHSLDHSVHPTMVELCDTEEYAVAYEKIRADEERAIDSLRRILGVRELVTVAPPGTDTAYAAHYVYADLGFSVYSGEWPPRLQERFRPRYFCNLFTPEYTKCIDEFLIRSTHEEIDAYIERAAGLEICVFFHHPQMAYHSEYWDLVHYNVTNVPEGQRREVARRPLEDTALHQHRLEYLVTKIQNDPRFRIITHKELASLYREEPRIVKKEDIPFLKRALEESFFPITFPNSYCISDLFWAARDFLLGGEEHLCEKVYGFLKEPSRLSAPAVVTRGDMVRSAEALTDGFLPPRIKVGDVQLNPAEWLFAALALLTTEEEHVTALPCDWQIDKTHVPELDFTYNKTWVFGDHFADRQASRLYAMQSWTYRFQKGTKRF